MKQKTKKRLIVACVFTTCFLLSGCFSKGSAPIYESDYFTYIHLCDNSNRQNSKDKSIVIVGFTEFGYEQEVLNIPCSIDGQPVKRIGLFDEGYPGGDKSRHIYCGNKLKKLYIPHTVVDIQYFHGDNVSLMICEESIRVVSLWGSTCKNKYISRELYEKVKDHKDDCFPANVDFQLNYQMDNEETQYRVDYVQQDETISMPPKPERDGYSFVGWYTDAECNNIWNFNSVPLIEEGGTLVLYAGWETL